jgi:hypothetical protein
MILYLIYVALIFMTLGKKVRDCLLSFPKNAWSLLSSCSPVWNPTVAYSFSFVLQFFRPPQHSIYLQTIWCERTALHEVAGLYATG